VTHTPLLIAEHVARQFGKRHVLEDVSFATVRGECVALVGENGAGKSTLLKILVGLLRPSRGAVHTAGRVGYCPQDAQLFDALTVDENLAYFAAALGSPTADWRVEADALAPEVQRFRERGTPVNELSGGTRQKVNLAVALLDRPDLLILDEPYAAFDWETYLRFWELAGRLRSAGRGVLIVSHFVSERERFDRVLELRAGVLQSATGGA
jgi:ABC-2 type transport system ATP-binding protein